MWDKSLRPRVNVNERNIDHLHFFSKLINAVKGHPILWDHRLPLRDRSELNKEKAWISVHRECGGLY